MVDVKFSLEEALIYQDEDILAVNKPPGLRVIPDGYQPELPCLSLILKETFGRIWVVHRLDKDTSGVILFARNSDSHRLLNQQFEQREVSKTYHALVTGIPDWNEMVIHTALKVNGDRRHRTIANPPNGKPAETTVHVIEWFSRESLIEAQPHSGYTHQIRAHLAYIGHPLLADELYGYRPEQSQQNIIDRVALHARRLQINHPCTLLPLTIEATYPPDFEQAVSILRKLLRN